MRKSERHRETNARLCVRFTCMKCGDVRDVFRTSSATCGDNGVPWTPEFVVTRCDPCLDLMGGTPVAELRRRYETTEESKRGTNDGGTDE